MSAAAVEKIFRYQSARIVAGLASATGDLELAQDAVQEAFVTALERWPRDGVPLNPAGWITTTAKHKAIDQLRRQADRAHPVGDPREAVHRPELVEPVVGADRQVDLRTG